MICISIICIIVLYYLYYSPAYDCVFDLPLTSEFDEKTKSPTFGMQIITIGVFNYQSRITKNRKSMVYFKNRLFWQPLLHQFIGSLYSIQNINITNFDTSIFWYVYFCYKIENACSRYLVKQISYQLRHNVSFLFMKIILVVFFFILSGNDPLWCIHVIA